MCIRLDSNVSLVSHAGTAGLRCPTAHRALTRIRYHIYPVHSQTSFGAASAGCLASISGLAASGERRPRGNAEAVPERECNEARYNSGMISSPKIVLASGSERRRKLVEAFDAEVEVVRPGVCERRAWPEEQAEEYVKEMAELKALSAASGAAAAGLVIGADTAVAVDGRILGKPTCEDEAKSMLTALRGRSHRVLTGVAVIWAENGAEASGVTSSEVTMRGYSDAEIARYVESGEPFDKAGGYAVQDEEFSPAARVDGCYLNVVGFPLCEVARLAREVGAEVWFRPDWRADERCPAGCALRAASKAAT